MPRLGGIGSDSDVLDGDTQSAIASLTDNITGVTPDDTVADFTDQVGSAGINPAADRDDTRAALAVIKADIADNTAKINAILVALRAANVIET